MEKRVWWVGQAKWVEAEAWPLWKRQGYVAQRMDDQQVQEMLQQGLVDGPDYFVLEVDSSVGDLITYLNTVIGRLPSTTLIVLSQSSKRSQARKWVQAGAYDVLFPPYRSEDVLVAIYKAEERRIVRTRAGSNLQAKAEVQEFSRIVAQSESMFDIFSTVKKIAAFKTTCLILGESGTGKELLAKAIHDHSNRSNKPFVTVNCGAIPENLLESELFGHVKGTFTGAIRDKKGLFEEADSGTVFLDEIGELPLLLQVKLLRVLQEEEIRRVGATTTRKIDVRIIAATLKDLAKEVAQDTFREDLFYRLNVLPIHIPPLRERREDILPLLNHFIQKFNKKLAGSVRGVHADALTLLLDYDWPGNVRELENTVERAMVLVSGDLIRVENLPKSVTRKVARGVAAMTPDDEFSIKRMNRALEESLILKALREVKGNRTQAAKLLEISHRALLYKIKEYDIEEKI